jgi:hypothetical protein
LNSPNVYLIFQGARWETTWGSQLPQPLPKKAVPANSGLPVSFT